MCWQKDKFWQICTTCQTKLLVYKAKANWRAEWWKNPRRFWKEIVWFPGPLFHVFNSGIVLDEVLIALKEAKKMAKRQDMMNFLWRCWKMKLRLRYFYVCLIYVWWMEWILKQERYHKSFSKILHNRPPWPNTAVAGDMGWTSSYIKLYASVFGHFYRARNMGDERLNRRIFCWADRYKTRYKNWNFCIYIKLEKHGIERLWYHRKEKKHSVYQVAWYRNIWQDVSSIVINKQEYTMLFLCK